MDSVLRSIFGLLFLASLGGGAFAFDIGSVPEVADFEGRNDPVIPADQWSPRLDRSLDRLVEAVKTRQGLTTDLYIPGETVGEHATGFWGEGTKRAGAPMSGSKLVEILGPDALPESVRSTNPYAQLTAKTEDVLRQKILAAPKGTLSPADVMGMALDASGGNYPLATLTAHSVLKGHSKQGRAIRDEIQRRGTAFDQNRVGLSQAEFDKHMDELSQKLRPHSEIVSRLENMRSRGAEGANDKVGPWYHTFGVLAAGSVHGGTDAFVGTMVEHGGKWLGAYTSRDPKTGKVIGGEAPFNPEKFTIDRKVAWRALNPVELGGYERDWTIRGPHPSEFIPDFYSNEETKLEAEKEHCKSALKQANGLVGSLMGSIEPGKINIARNDIAALRGSALRCPELQEKIAAVDKMVQAATERVLERAQSSRASCDPALIREAATEAGAVLNEPRIAAVSQDLQAAAKALETAKSQAAAAMTDFAASRDSGDFFGMQGPLEKAKAVLEALGNDACFGKQRARIDELIAKVTKLRPDFEAANAAIGACNLQELERLKGSFAAGVSVAAQQMSENLNAAQGGCLEKKRAEATNKCRALLGQFGTAEVFLQGDDRCDCVPPYMLEPGGARCIDPKTEERVMAEGTEWCRSRYGQVAYATRQREDGTFSCDCTGDYELDFSVGRCVGATPETIAAERTAQCEHDNGAGYTAGTVLADGSFHCVPPASVADADCKNLYGSDWYAGSAKGDGSYMCHQKMTKDSARASCISAYGRRFIRVVYQNGEYRCEYSRGGRRRPRPDAGADAEAIGTAIGIGAGILINEMAKRKRSRGQGGGKCHRDPNTGQVHCGGN